MPRDASTQTLLDSPRHDLLVELVRKAVRAELDASADGRQGPAKLLTLAEVAAVLGVSMRTVQRLVCRGEIGTVRAGAIRRVHPDALDAYVRSTAR